MLRLVAGDLQASLMDLLYVLGRVNQGLENGETF